MSNEKSAILDRPAGWSVDKKGYIHGGFGTPIFEKQKHKHNSQLTMKKRAQRREDKEKLKFAKTLAQVIQMPVGDHIIQKDS